MILKCHCGNVQLTVEHTPQTLTACNCSVCNRYGSLWGYYTPQQVKVDVQSNELTRYRWGKEHLDFVSCSKCSCLTHYETTENVSEQKVGVNFRMAPQALTAPIKVRHFDGADTWKYLD